MVKARSVQKYKDMPNSIDPTEDTCPYCPGLSSPSLRDTVPVARHGVVYGVSSVGKGTYIFMSAITYN